MGSQRTLVVVGQTGVMLVPLPWKGSQLFVGRDAFCEVHLADEQVSRQHARLTRERVATAATETAAAPEPAPATETTMLADLGSRNGTTVDGRRVDPASPVTLAVGSVVRIGNALLVIEDRKGPARLQLVAGVGALVRGVDDEIARAVAEGSTFALVEVRIEGGEGRPGSASPRDRAGRAAAPLFYAWQEGQYVTLDAEHMVTTGLRDGDVLAPLGEGVWLALLPKATPARARQQAARLSLLLEEAGFQARVRLALFPDQGTTSDALLLALGEGGEADEAAGAAEADEADDAAEAAELAATDDAVEAGEAGDAAEAGEAGDAAEAGKAGPAGDAAEAGPAGEGQAGEGQAGEGQAGEGQAGEGQAGEGQAGLSGERACAERSLLGEALPVGAPHSDDWPQLSTAPLGAAEIAELAARFVARACEEMQRPDLPRLSPQALAWLEADGWPDDERAFQSVIERAVLVCDGPVITLEHLPIGRWRRPSPQPSHLRGETADFGRGYVLSEGGY